MVVRLLQQVWEFIVANPVTIGGWVVALLSGAFVAPYVAHWLRRREEKRGEHLVQLKREVLQPMLAFLDDHVLPILRHETGNVDICSKQFTDPTGLEGPFFEQFTCVRQVTEPLQVHTFGEGAVPEIPLPPSGPLVQDARQHHFRSLLRRWDQMLVRFLEYNGACRQHVETLRTQLAQENDLLPEFTLRADALGPEWVNAAALAVIIFLKQIGLPLRELTYRPQSNPREWCYNSITVAKGAVGKMLPLEKQVKDLLRQRDQVLRLMETAKSLAAEAAAVRAAIDEQRVKPRLPGRCSFL